MAKELQSIEIRPAENGGHTVRHEFKRRAVMRKGSMSGGMGMEYPPSEEHVFGPAEGKKMLGHVGKHLGISSKGPSTDQEESEREADA